MVLFMLALAPSSPAGAEPTPEEKRAATRAKQAELAAQIDTLRASDDQLESAVQALDAGVAAQSATNQAAQQALHAAQASLGTAQSRLTATETRMTDLRQRAAAVAVQAYVHPSGDPILQIIKAKDLSEASRRQTLLATVASTDRDVLDQLRAARQDQQLEREQLMRARDVADERTRAAAEKLAGLERALADQTRLKSALEGRIARFSAEVEALSAEEAALSATIRARQAAAASAAAARAAPAPAAAPAGVTPIPGVTAAPSVAAPPSIATRASGGGMVWPTTGSVTSSFGERWGRLHAGLDIANDLGTPIRAAKGGTVILAGWNGGYGNSIVIDHGGGLSTLYAHASRLRAAEGQAVGQGELIADMGSTGNSTGSHLHFETRVNGSPRNPAEYLP